MNTLKNIPLMLYTLFATVLTSHSVVNASPLGEYFQQYPWLGLVTNEFTYGPVTVRNVHLSNEEKIVFAQPGDEIQGSLEYSLDMGKINKFYYLVIGIAGEGGTDFTPKMLNLQDNEGIGNFSVKAPTKPGVYQIRFIVKEALTIADEKVPLAASNIETSSVATIAVIIVKSHPLQRL